MLYTSSVVLAVLERVTGCGELDLPGATFAKTNTYDESTVGDNVTLTPEPHPVREDTPIIVTISAFRFESFSNGTTRPPVSRWGQYRQ